MIKKNLRGAVILTIIALVSFALLAIASGDSSDSDDTDGYSDIEYWVAAQNVVEFNLKSPSSAKYPWYDDSFVSKSGGDVIVSAYVDADNSYGAKIRIYFKITFIGGEVDNYTTEFN